MIRSTTLDSKSCSIAYLVVAIMVAFVVARGMADSRVRVMMVGLKGER